MSEDVFREDPLLLEKKNQETYGETLIWNLLVGRTIASGVPDMIDLHDKDLGQLDNRFTYDPDPPAASIVAAYSRDRKFRQELSVADREALEKFTMVSRGEKTARRLRNITENGRELTRLPVEQDAQDNAKEDGYLKNRLKIAAVGFRVKISKLIGKGQVNEDLCVLERLPPPPSSIRGVPDKSGIGELGRTRSLRARRAGTSRWAETVCSHIEKAVRAGSHIVFLPEFALPPQADLEMRIRKYCSDSPHPHAQFIFAGSRHEGGSNRGQVYYVKDKQPQPDTHWHYKVASARSLRENVLGPHSDAFPTYIVTTHVDRTKVDLNVTIAICYDAFDPSTFLSMVMSTAAQDEYFTNRIILVPSFNPSRQFVECLRDLSFLAQCPVVYVNSLHGDARMFVAGVAISDVFEDADRLLDQIRARLDKLRTERREEQERARDQERKNDTSDIARATAEARHIDKRIEALDALLARLDVIKHSGGLRHLLTVERCADCEANAHKDDYGCATDILYYNIDVRLLEALQRFRTSYFRTDESFIPGPFRRDKLAEAVQLSVAKKAKRDRLLNALKEEMAIKRAKAKVRHGTGRHKKASAPVKASGRKRAARKR